MHAAVNRHTVTGRDLGQADEALTPEEALHSYTMGGAFAVGREDRLGSITPANWPTSLCSTAIHSVIDPSTLDAVTPTRTMLGGEWVWEG